ncbi:MAG TPA: carboxypeptidase-like regulatory domain-containing protein, partial [Pyrinomonadaceae bacterium]|nr:carboxypeptidase-like regulatory domain-containing protein [Pyrinomonadaceae bacterium]
MFRTSKHLPPLTLMNAIVWAAVVLLTPSPMFAQTDYARITVVLSPIASGVNIVLVGERGRVRECTTGAEGTCTFSGLKPGTYGIQLPDLSKAVDVFVLPGQHITRTIETTQGIATTKATRLRIAHGEAQQAKQRVRLLDRIIPGRRGDITTSQELEELPNRSQTEAPLLERQPGAVATGVNTFDGFIFNGQPATQNVLRENGLSSNPIVRSSASFQDPNALFADIGDRQSIKSFDTFEVDTSNTPASFGTGTGTQLVKTVKKGKDSFGAEIYEYLANDAFSARNFFDFDRKPSLRFNLFGFNVTGPLGDHLLAFFNYEGVRASSGNTLFAAAPKLSLVTNADPAVAGLLRSFRASGASIVANASGDPDFDIIQLEAKNRAERNGVSTRIDYEPSETEKFSIMYSGSRATTDFPDGASGRRTNSSDSSHKAVFNYEHAFTKDAQGNPTLNNQFIFGVINSPAHLFARFEDNVGPNLFNSAVNMGGEVSQTGIAGQPPTLTVSAAGGLLGGDFAGRNLIL